MDSRRLCLHLKESFVDDKKCMKELCFPVELCFPDFICVTIISYPSWRLLTIDVYEILLLNIKNSLDSCIEDCCTLTIGSHRYRSDTRVEDRR